MWHSGTFTYESKYKYSDNIDKYLYIMCLEKFIRYSNNCNMMEGRMFLKLCKEAKLIDNNLTTVNCDIAYTQAVKRGQKFLDYESFIKALDEIAFIKGISLENVIEKIESTNGPIYTSTTTVKPNRLYDDKHNYTGIHSRRYSLPIDFN